MASDIRSDFDQVKVATRLFSKLSAYSMDDTGEVMIASKVSGLLGDRARRGLFVFGESALASLL